MAHDGSSAAFGLNQVLVDPDADYGDIGGILCMLSLGAHMAGLDFRGCFLNWLATTASRRLLAYDAPSQASCVFFCSSSSDRVLLRAGATGVR